MVFLWLPFVATKKYKKYNSSGNYKIPRDQSLEGTLVDEWDDLGGTEGR